LVLAAVTFSANIAGTGSISGALAAIYEYHATGGGWCCCKTLTHTQPQPTSVASKSPREAGGWTAELPSPRFPTLEDIAGIGKSSTITAKKLDYLARHKSSAMLRQGCCKVAPLNPT